MAKIYNYHTRIGQDDCFLTERDIENDAFSRYNSGINAPCSAQQCLEFATSEHQTPPTGGKSFTDVGGHGVDVDSSLRLAPSTQSRERLNLVQRPFATVPYLGRGVHNPDVEGRLRIGVPTNERRQNDSVTERMYRGNQPLVPSLAATISNPANLVESVASDGWIRGGLPSRQLSKVTADARN